MRSYGLFYAVEVLFGGSVFVLIGAAVAHDLYNVVFVENRISRQQLFQCLYALDTVQIPEGMGKLLPQLRRGKRILLLRRQRVQELLDLCLVDELPGLVRVKELVQVECIIRRFLGLQVGMPDPLPDHRRQLIGVHGKARKRLIGVISLSAPVFLAFLFVGIRPVIDLAGGEPRRCQLLKRRTGQIQGILPGNIIESALGAHGLDPFLRLVNDEQVKLYSMLRLPGIVLVFLRHPCQLVELAAKVDRALQALQGLKGNHAPVGCMHPGNEFLPGKDARFPGQRVRIRNKG